MIEMKLFFCFIVLLSVWQIYNNLFIYLMALHIFAASKQKNYCFFLSLHVLRSNDVLN